MIPILPGNVATALGGAYEVANSCKFGTNTYMDKDNSASSPTHADKYTISFWCKKCNTSGGGSGAPAEDGYTLFMSSGSGTNGDASDHYCQIYFKHEDDIRWQEYDDGTSGQLETNQVFRDPSAWYHLVFRFDSTDGTADDRMRIYVNGTQVTSFQVRANIDQNTDSWVNYASAGHRIGGGGTRHFDGYLAEFVLVDGQSLAPTEFGEFDEDSPTIWKAKDVSGITLGTHGYYLDFESSGTLGNDANGGTDFTVANLVAADQALDSPTNNFCTMNSLFNGQTMWSSDIAVQVSGGRTTEGNCKVSGGEHMPILGTMATNKMKVYYEVYISAADVIAGFMSTSPAGNSAHSYDDNFSNSIYVYGAGGSIINNGSWTSTAGLTSAGNYMFAFDPVAGKMWFGKDGTWTGDPAAGSGNSWSSISSDEEWTPYFHTLNTTAYPAANFGGCSAFTVSSGNTDANGYGNFEYAVPSGFYALCTKNLAELGG